MSRHVAFCPDCFGVLHQTFPKCDNIIQPPRRTRFTPNLAHTTRHPSSTEVNDLHRTGLKTSDPDGESYQNHVLPCLVSLWPLAEVRNIMSAWNSKLERPTPNPNQSRRDEKQESGDNQCAVTRRTGHRSDKNFARSGESTREVGRCAPPKTCAEKFFSQIDENCAVIGRRYIIWQGGAPNSSG